jgi:hypothetical protein
LSYRYLIQRPLGEVTCVIGPLLPSRVNVT